MKRRGNHDHSLFVGLGMLQLINLTSFEKVPLERVTGRILSIFSW